MPFEYALLTAHTRSLLELDRDVPPTATPGRSGLPRATRPGAVTGPVELPAAVRARFERALGADFSKVRIAVDDEAERHGARAFARGHELHFAPGAYDPGSTSGLELIGHELQHVVQQGRGQTAGAALEHEANDYGRRAASGEQVAPAGQRVEPAIGGAVQRQKSLLRDQYVKIGALRGIVIRPIGTPGEETAYEVLTETAEVKTFDEPLVELDADAHDPDTVEDITQFLRKTATCYVADRGQLFTWQTFHLPQPAIPALISNSAYVKHYEQELPLRLQLAATPLSAPVTIGGSQTTTGGSGAPKQRDSGKDRDDKQRDDKQRDSKDRATSQDDKREVRPLHAAVERNRVVDLIRALAQPVSLDEVDADGNTALHLAVIMRRLELARRLLDARASTKIANHVGDLPLHVAIRRDHPDMVALLLGYGANPKARDADGHTPAVLAQSLGYDRLVPLLSTEAEDFELELGRALFRHPKVESGMSEMIERVDRAIRYTATGGLVAHDGTPFEDGAVDDMRARRMGTADTTKGGAVGTRPRDVRDATVGGVANVRTQMTALNMYTKSGALDLMRISAERDDLHAQSKALEDINPRDGTATGPLIKAVWADHDSTRTTPTQGKPGHHNPRAVHSAAPRMSPEDVSGKRVEERRMLARMAAETAIERKLAKIDALKLNWKQLAKRVPAKLPTESQREAEDTTVIAHSPLEPIASQDGARKPRGGASTTSARTYDDVYETSLSIVELEFLIEAMKLEVTGVLDDMLMPWIEGGSMFTVDETHTWVADVLARGVPLLAGPSGTSEKLLQLGTLFNFDTRKMALACLAWMLPGSGNDHSFFEIMAVATDHLPGAKQRKPDDLKTDISYTSGLSQLLDQKEVEALRQQTTKADKFPAYAKRKGAMPEADGIGRAQSLKLRAANQTYQVWMEIGGTPAVCIHSFDGEGELAPDALRAEVKEVNPPNAIATHGTIGVLEEAIHDAKQAALGIELRDGDAQLVQLAAVTQQLKLIPVLITSILGDLAVEGEGGAYDLYKGVQLSKTLGEREYEDKRNRQKPAMPTQSPALRARIDQLLKSEGIVEEEATAQAHAEIESAMSTLIANKDFHYKGVTYEDQLDAMLSIYVKNLKVLKSDLRSEGEGVRDVPWSQDKAHLAGVPQMSTSKNPRQAVFYAVGEKKPEHKRRTEGVIGQMYIYVVPRNSMTADFKSKRAVDILASNQSHKDYKQDHHKLTESEVTFMTEIPGDYLVEVMDIQAGDEYVEISERAKLAARKHAARHGGLRRWKHLG